jgi:non-heme chloroperoxidase
VGSSPTTGTTSHDVMCAATAYPRVMTYFPTLPDSVVESRVRVADDIDLRVLRAGSGAPLVLIPGWTIPADVFVNQLIELSDAYDVIAIDPRGHGGSSKPLEGNSFPQRGADLGALLEALDLSEVALAGWSFGILDALSYLQQSGHDRVARLILIDEPPKVVADPANPAEWGEATLSHDGLPAFIQFLSTNRAAFWDFIATHALGLETEQAATHPDARTLIEWGLQTPEHIAIITGVEGLASDFSAPAIEFAESGKPLLFLARDEWADDARRWVEANLPGAEFDTIRTHAAFATDAAEFNARIRTFLSA